MPGWVLFDKKAVLNNTSNFIKKLKLSTGIVKYKCKKANKLYLRKMNLVLELLNVTDVIIFTQSFQLHTTIYNINKVMFTAIHWHGRY